MTTVQVQDQPQTPNLFKAMAQAFHKIKGALKTGDNPYYNSKYADFASVEAAVSPALEPYGLFFVQYAHPKEGFACIETVICHESGERLSCGITEVPVSKNDAQGFGSSQTYARRYSLAAAFGVAPEAVGGDKDDDGNRSCGLQRPEKKKPAAVVPLTPEEVAAFAKEIAAKTRSAGCEVNEAKLTSFFHHCQKQRPEKALRDLINASVEKDPKVFADNLSSWVRKSEIAA